MKPLKTNNGSLKEFGIGIAIVAVLIPSVFWMRFGRVDGYVIACAAFLIILLTGVQFLPGLTDKYKDEDTAAVNAVKPSWFDRLAIVWICSIPFSPFVSWVISELLIINVNNWHVLLGIKAGLCVALPCISVLPLTRYLVGKTAAVAALVLTIGTLFPVIIGWNSAMDLIEGVHEERVAVKEVSPIYYYRNGSKTATDVAELTLEDGRKFTSDRRCVTIKPGQATLGMLTHVEVVVSAR